MTYYHGNSVLGLLRRVRIAQQTDSPNSCVYTFGHGRRDRFVEAKTWLNTHGSRNPIFHPHALWAAPHPPPAPGQRWLDHMRFILSLLITCVYVCVFSLIITPFPQGDGPSHQCTACLCDSVGSPWSNLFCLPITCLWFLGQKHSPFVFSVAFPVMVFRTRTSSADALGH